MVAKNRGYMCACENNENEEVRVAASENSSLLDHCMQEDEKNWKIKKIDLVAVPSESSFYEVKFRFQVQHLTFMVSRFSGKSGHPQPLGLLFVRTIGTTALNFANTFLSCRRNLPASKCAL